ncbi:MAG: hypothetical protein R2827_10045 [Bdellovibrionales bacterium]
MELPGRAGAKNAWELKNYEDTSKYYEGYFTDLKKASPETVPFL